MLTVASVLLVAFAPLVASVLLTVLALLVASVLWVASALQAAPAVPAAFGVLHVVALPAASLAAVFALQVAFARAAEFVMVFGFFLWIAITRALNPEDPSPQTVFFAWCPHCPLSSILLQHVEPPIPVPSLREFLP